MDFFSCKDRDTLTSLENAPSVVNDFIDLDRCYGLTSLEGIGVKYLQEINGAIYLPIYLSEERTSSIKSNMLGLLKVKRLKVLDTWQNSRGEFNTVINIINKHLEDRDIVKCRNELIEAGLKEYAKF